MFRSNLPSIARTLTKRIDWTPKFSPVRDAWPGWKSARSKVCSSIFCGTIVSYWCAEATTRPFRIHFWKLHTRLYYKALRKWIMFWAWLCSPNRNERFVHRTYHHRWQHRCCFWSAWCELLPLRVWKSSHVTGDLTLCVLVEYSIACSLKLTDSWLRTRSYFHISLGRDMFHEQHIRKGANWWFLSVLFANWQDVDREVERIHLLWFSYSDALL